MSQATSPNAKSRKSRVSEELEQLRQQGLAKTGRGRIKDSGAFLTPEEAEAFLKSAQLKAKKKQEKPTPPTHLSASDLLNWYSRQRQMELEERRKREEAEAFLRGYRSKLDYNGNAVPGASGKSDSSSGTLEGGIIVTEGIEHVKVEVEKIENDLAQLEINNDEYKSKLEYHGNIEISDKSETSDAFGTEEGIIVTEAVEHVTTHVEKIENNLAHSDNIHDENQMENGKDGNGEMDGSYGKDSADLLTALDETKIEPSQESSVMNIKTDEDKVSVDKHPEIHGDELINAPEQERSIAESVLFENADGTSHDIEVEVADNNDTETHVIETGVFHTKEKDFNNSIEADFDKDDMSKTVDDADERKEDVIQEPLSSLLSSLKTLSATSTEGWNNSISREPDAMFPPEADRYHLYVSYACPWAHRTVIVRNLKGLQDAIGVTYVHPTWQFTKPGVDDHRGWVFGSPNGKSLSNTAGIGSFPSDWGEEDPNMGAKCIRDIYEMANDTTGKYILPVLWDKKRKTIVSNESSAIMRMLNSEFNEYATNPNLDLYPSHLQADIDEINNWVYPSINNGVYRCGLASTQEAYDDAIDELTDAFDKVDNILQKQRFLIGQDFTEADVRLFVTLIRFDEVYDIYFKCNTRSVAGTPSLLNYVREIYQMKGITESCRMDMIKAHYYTSHVELNKYSIIPRGDNFLSLLRQPHNRNSL